MQLGSRKNDPTTPTHPNLRTYQFTVVQVRKTEESESFILNIFLISLSTVPLLDKAIYYTDLEHWV